MLTGNEWMFNDTPARNPEHTANRESQQTLIGQFNTTARLHWQVTENTDGQRKEGRKEIFYLTTHSTHFIYSYMGYSFRLATRVLLYAPSHRQDRTYNGLCYTSCGALAGTRNSSMGPSHEGSIRRPIAPWANALTTELHLAPDGQREITHVNW